MATVTKKKLSSQLQWNAPDGNHTSLDFKLETSAAGVFVDSDQATALQIADKVRLGILPAGMKLKDALAVVSDAFTALVTANIGFEYVDGVDSAAVPQNASYFHAAVALNALGRYPSNSNVAPVTLPKDAYLIATMAGAACAAVGIADIMIVGVLTGAP